MKTQLSNDVLKQIIGLYDGEIAYVDNEVKRIVNELDELGLQKNTIVVITADHGEELYDRNFHFGHGASIYDSVLKIPLVIRLPGVLPQNRKIKSVVQSVDISPTVLELLSIPKSARFEGKSLRDLIFSSTEPKNSSPAYSEIRDKITSIRTSEWRYIDNPEGFQPHMIFSTRQKDQNRNKYFIDQREMYFLPNDPAEQSNVIDRNEKIAGELKSALSEWRKQSSGAYHPKEIDEETKEELKGLGYIQ